MIEFVPPKNTDAVAFIHNHPSSNTMPSYEDTMVFLDLVINNPDMRYSIIAATNGGEVNGFLQMTYNGEKPNGLVEEITDFYNALCKKRMEEIQERGNSGRFWGKPIFTLDELKAIDVKVMVKADFSIDFVPMSGYRREDYEFRK